MKLDKIEWSNIFSYGNNHECIEFDGGSLWQLCGKSGAGKSSIISMPQLLIYGKVEKVKVGSIANRINKSGKIKGYITKGSDKYIIERTFSPQSLSISKNGVPIDKAGSKDMQSIIDDEIMDGMPYNIFSNVLNLSLNNFKSFISMTPDDKRKIIDRIFSLEIINKVNELIKKDLRDLSMSVNVSNNQIFTLEDSIKKANAELALVEEKEKEKVSLSNLDELTEKLNKLDNLIKTCDEDINKYNKKYSEIDIAYRKNSQVIYEENSKLRTCNEKLVLFNNDKCPTCSTPFDSENFIDLKNNIQLDIDNIKANIAVYNKHQTDSKTALDKITAGLNILNGNKITLNNHRNATVVEMEKIKASNNTAEVKESIGRIIESSKESIKNIQINLDNDSSEIDLLNELSNIYSTDGIKKEIMENYIPSLNTELMETLSYLHFPYTLDFDSEFNPHLEHIGEEIEVSTLSTGERKKVDLAVLCAIIKMIKMKYPQINLICLDETLSSLDYESSVDLLSYLKKISSDLGLNIFIVSHTTLDASMFDHRILIEKNDGFSSMKYI